MTYPQKWCGQTQPHYAHTWGEGTMGLYQDCAGYAVAAPASVDTATGYDPNDLQPEAYGRPPNDGPASPALDTDRGQ